MTLRVPVNWPLAWWGSDGTQVKMACPGCGGWSLLLTRSAPDGATKSLICDACGLSGQKPVQDALDAWVVAAARAARADAENLAVSREEGNRGVAVIRQQATKKAPSGLVTTLTSRKVQPR